MKLFCMLLFSLLFSFNTFAVELKYPYRIALTDDGRLFVTDSALKRVVIINTRSSKIIKSFFVSTNGTPSAIDLIPQSPKITTPFKLTKNTRGDRRRIPMRPVKNYWAVVGNDTTKQIEVYDEDGDWKYNFSKSVGYATDITIDIKSDRVFVVNGETQIVDVFSVDGNFIGHIPEYGRDVNRLSNPRGITVDSANDIVLITDHGSTTYGIKARIQLFSYEGALLGSISGSRGMMGVKFSKPQGIITDSSGNIYLVESVSGEILIFNRFTGEQLPTVDRDLLNYPQDIALSPKKGDLFISSPYDKEIKIFRGEAK